MTATGRNPKLSVVRSGESSPVTVVTRARLSRRETAPDLDDEVVEAAKRGDRAAWEAAYVAYGKGLMGFLILRLGDRDDAAEALSETFLRALSKARSVRGGPSSFRSWLYRIARNVAIDRLRARNRITLVDRQLDGTDLLLADADDGLVRAEEARRVRAAFRALDPDDREVVWLRICAGLTSAEVGEIVGKRPGAVRMQQQRALAAMARQVEA